MLLLSLLIVGFRGFGDDGGGVTFATFGLILRIRLDFRVDDASWGSLPRSELLSRASLRDAALRQAPLRVQGLL